MRGLKKRPERRALSAGFKALFFSVIFFILNLNDFIYQKWYRSRLP
jgi:hypothetical protein